jgi:hypothetical protein
LNAELPNVKLLKAKLPNIENYQTSNIKERRILQNRENPRGIIQIKQIHKFRFHTITVGSRANMLCFVKNRKGGNNLQDSNGYLYCVSKVIMDKDRSWHCVASKSDSCPATANTVTSSHILVSQQGEHTQK